MKQVKKVRWLLVLKGLVCDSGNFEINSLFDGKPVELDKSGRDVMATFNGWSDKAG